MPDEKPAKLVMRRMSELRQFSEAEAQKVIDYTKSNHPELWQEIERIEKTTAHFTDTEAGNAEDRILARIHPECNLADLANLGFAVRALRRKQFGLT